MKEIKVLVVKSNDSLIFSQNGKRLIINKDSKLFNQLKDLEKEELEKWYISR